MFRHGEIQDDELIHIANVAQKYEADLISNMLAREGIPCIVYDREDSGGYLRTLGVGSPYGMDVYVNRSDAETAQKLVEEILSDQTEISDEELTRLALGTEPESL